MDQQLLGEIILTLRPLSRKKLQKWRNFHSSTRSSFSSKHEVCFSGSRTIAEKHLLTYPNLNVYCVLEELFKQVEILRNVVSYSNHKRNDFLPQYCGYVKSDTLYCINPLSSISKTFWAKVNFSRILIVGWAETTSCLPHLLKLVAVFQTFTTFHVFFFSSQMQFW